MKKGFSILIVVVSTMIINLNSDSFTPLLGQFVKTDFFTIKDEPKMDFTSINSYGQDEKSIRHIKRAFKR